METGLLLSFFLTLTRPTKMVVSFCAFRMYGALTGLSKLDTADTLGSELVQEWRGSLRTQPPALQLTSPFWPGKDRKYADLTADQIPLTESLLDCMTRTEPVWRNKILYEINQGRNVLVVAHANTLRGLVKIIDNIGDDEIQGTSYHASSQLIYFARFFCAPVN